MEVKKVQTILAQMQKNLECTICLEMMSNPISTNCGHQFCRFCIMEFLGRKKQMPCPLCKKTITKRSLTERQQLGGMVNSIRQLISAFQLDTGEMFSPPRGSQAHVIPSTQELSSREPDRCTRSKTLDTTREIKGESNKESEDTAAGLDTEELLRCITDGLHGGEETDTETPETMDIDHPGDNLNDMHVAHVDNDSKSKLLLEMIENGSHGAVESTDEETSDAKGTSNFDMASATINGSQSAPSVNNNSDYRGKDLNKGILTTHDNVTIVLSGNSEAKQSDIDASENSSGMCYSLFRTPLDPKTVKKGKVKETEGNRPRRSTRTKTSEKSGHDSEDEARSKVVDDTPSNIGGVSFLDEKKIQHTYNRKNTINKSKDMAGKKKVEEWLKHIPQCPEPETNSLVDTDKKGVKQGKLSGKKAQKLKEDENLMGKRIKHLSEKVQETNKDLLFQGESFMSSPKPPLDQLTVAHDHGEGDRKEKQDLHADVENETHVSYSSKHKQNISDKVEKMVTHCEDKRSKSNIAETVNKEAFEIVKQNVSELDRSNQINPENRNENTSNESSSTKSSPVMNDAKPVIPIQLNKSPIINEQEEMESNTAMPKLKKRIFKTRAQSIAKLKIEETSVETAVQEVVNSGKESKHSLPEFTANQSKTSCNDTTNGIKDGTICTKKVNGVSVLDPYEFVSSQNTPVKQVKGKKNAKSKAKSTKPKKIPLAVQKQNLGTNSAKSKTLNKGINNSHIQDINNKSLQTASQIEIDRVSANLDQADNYEFLTSTQDALNEFATEERSLKGDKKKKVSFREPELCDFIQHGKVDVLGYRKAKAEVDVETRESNQPNHSTSEIEEKLKGAKRKDVNINRPSEEGKENEKPPVAECDVDRASNDSDDDVSGDWRFQDDNSSGTDDLDIEPSVEEFEQPNIEIQTEEMKAMLSQEMFEKHVLLKSPVVMEQKSPDPSIIAETPQLFAVPIFKSKAKPESTKYSKKDNVKNVAESYDKAENDSSQTKSSKKKSVKRKNADSADIVEDTKEVLTVVPETPLIPYDSIEDGSIVEILETKVVSTGNPSNMEQNGGGSTQGSEETQAPSTVSGEMNDIENMNVDEQTCVHSVNTNCSQGNQADASQTFEVTDNSTQDSESLLLPKLKRKSSHVKNKKDKTPTQTGSRKRKRKCFSLEDDKSNSIDKNNEKLKAKDLDSCCKQPLDSDIVHDRSQSVIDCSQASAISVRSASQISEKQIGSNIETCDRKNGLEDKDHIMMLESQNRENAKAAVYSMTIIPDSVVDDLSKIPYSETDISKVSDSRVDDVIQVSDSRTDDLSQAPDSRVYMSQVPDSRVDGMSQVPDPRVDDMSQVTDSKVDDVSKVPDSRVDDMSLVPDSRVDDVSQVPDSRVDDVSQVPDSRVDDVSQVTDSRVDDVSQVSDSRVDDISQVPDSKVDDVVQVPDSKSDDMSNDRNSKVDVSQVPDSRADDISESMEGESDICTRRLSSLLSSVDQILEETKSSQELRRITKSLHENKTTPVALTEFGKIPQNTTQEIKGTKQLSQKILNKKEPSQTKTKHSKHSQNKKRKRNVSGLLVSPQVSQSGSPENIFAADSEMPVIESSPMDDTLQPVQLSDVEEVSNITKHDTTIDKSTTEMEESIDKHSERPGDHASLDMIPQTCSQKSKDLQGIQTLEHGRKFSTPSPSTKRKSVKTARGFSKKQRNSASPQLGPSTEASPISKAQSIPRHRLNKSLTSSPTAKYKSPKLAVTHNLPLFGQSPISANGSPLGKRQQSFTTPAKSPLLTPSKYSPSICKQNKSKSLDFKASFEPEVVDLKPDESMDFETVVTNENTDSDSIIGTPLDLPDIEDGTQKCDLPSSTESEQVKKKSSPKISPKLILQKNDIESEGKHFDSRDKISNGKSKTKSKDVLSNSQGSDVSEDKCTVANSHEKFVDKKEGDIKHLNNPDDSNSSSDLNLDSLIEEENIKNGCDKNFIQESKVKDIDDDIATSPEFTLDSSGEDIKEHAMKVIDKFNEIKSISKNIDNDVDRKTIVKCNKDVSVPYKRSRSKPDCNKTNDNKSEFEGNEKHNKSPMVINNDDNVYSTNLDSSPAQPEVILESDIESEEEKETNESEETESESDEDEVVRRKNVKKAVIESSSEDDDDNSRQMNLTSSSAFSSQSENLTTQDRLSLEKELERMEREMKNVKEQLKKNKRSHSPQKDNVSVVPVEDSDSDMIEADDTGDEMDPIFISLPPPSPPRSQEFTNRVDHSSELDEKEDYSAGPEDTPQVVSANWDHTEQEENVSESQMETVPPSLSDQPDESTVMSVRPALVDLDTNVDNSTKKIGQKRLLGFVATGLSVQQIQEVKKLAALNDAKFYNRFNSAITHVIVKPDPEDDLLCDRTLKFFQGVANRCWVVNHFWVVDSRQVGHLLPESGYEIQGDTATGEAHQGPKKSRLSSKHLLKGLQFSLIGDNAYLSKESMRELIETCGGHVVCVEDLDPSTETAFVISCTDIEEEGETSKEGKQIQTESKNLYRLYQVLTLTREWVLDSITLYKLQPLHEYVVTNVKSGKIPTL